MNGLDGLEVIGSFNNEGRKDVAAIKEAAIALIDLIVEHGNDPYRNERAANHIEEAAMLAIKSIFS